MPVCLFSSNLFAADVLNMIQIQYLELYQIILLYITNTIKNEIYFQ